MGGSAGVHLMRHGPKRFCSFLPLVTSRRSVSKTQKMPAAESPASLRAVPSRQSVSYDVFVPCIPYDSHYQICYSTMPPRTVWELDAVGGQLIRQPASSHVLVGDATPLASSQPSNCASDPRQASVGAPFCPPQRTEQSSPAPGRSRVSRISS